jgi:hypothetical protein
VPPSADAQPAAPDGLSDTTRRFLAPLVGIDPGQVRVYRGAEAAQAAAAQGADGLAGDDAVALGAGHAEDTPATLGLLAHELAHVARRREARFVPPIARQHQPDSADEEAVAQATEQAVARAAEASAAPQSQPAASGAQPGAWQGLPAPWEPLPDWLAGPSATPAAPAARAVAPFAPGAAPLASAPQAAAPGPPIVQRAEVGREASAPLPMASLSTAEASEATPAEQVEPNLDLLARQVYTMLKRRLAAERRRSGM